MAHNLSGNVSDFGSLEHVDPGKPKTTDLDEALSGLAAPIPQSVASGSGAGGQAKDSKDGPSSSQDPNPEMPTADAANSTGEDNNRTETRRPKQIETIKRRLERFEMDKEDVVTVRYFPIKFTNQEDGQEEEHPHQQSGPDLDQKSQTHSDDKDTLYPLPHWSSSRVNHQEMLDESGAKEDPRERIVEHIRKNFSLFETNRETYSTSPAYTNRGHLQSVLVQKQHNQSSDNNSPKSHQQPFATKSARLNDQYTQYRASDLIGAQDQRESFFKNKQQRGVTLDSKLIAEEQAVDQHRQQQLLLLQDRQRHTARAISGGIKNNKSNSSSLKRSVSSLNGLLKRQVEFVKSKTGRNQQLKDRQQVEQANASQNTDQEDQYKVPAKQTFVGASSLYLLPAPDHRVHIATLVVKDIILAYQRAKHNETIKDHRRSTKSTNRLTQLFKTYSFRKSELESIAQQQKSIKTSATSDNHSLTRSFRSGGEGERTRGLRRSAAKSIQFESTLDHSVSKIRAKVKMPSGKTDKATIVDNKDGTVKITYEPKEEGAHEISLRYNDEPVDDGPIVFYVDSVGSAKKKITAYGPGLTRGLVGEQNKFTINTGGLGSAKLNVTVEGPSKTQVELSDNRDGTITVSYSALVPGEYKIKISFDGKQVVGSPFITEINDEGRQRSHLNVGRASEHTLDFKISEEDLKTIDAIIVTPCGLEEPAELKLMKNGQLAIMFTPREQGDHIVNVKRRGNHIAGSPFRFDVLSRDIGDAKQVKVSGKGLKEGKANAENEIIINTKDAGYGGLSVALEGPGRSEILSKEVTDSTIKLSYQPYEPGQYSLMVKYADHVVPGSPFSIKVSGQGTNSQKESFRKFRKLQPVAEPNTECHFSFKQPGVSAYDLSAKIHSPQGSSEDVSIKDKGDFVYQVSFVPKEVGLFALSIRNKEIHIAGSPFPFTVGPLLDFGPHKVRCGGPGLIKGAVNKLNEFDIYTREAGTGELHVVMEGPSKPELKYTDRKDGSCHVGYKVSQAGEYRVSVFFNDHEVPDSPFRTVVMAPTGDVAKIELGPMPPDSMIQLNKPYNMTVIMNGAKGNIEGKVKVPSGKIEDCFASPIDAENWGVRFIPREYGIYQVYIKCKGSHIPQSPLFVRVGHDNADPAAILVHGHGLRAAIVNHATDFIVETCNAGHSMLEVNIEGPSKVSMGCAELDEGYKINYTPLAPGDYLISIKYNGCHIGSSPFKVRATKQPGSRTVADAGSHEISTIAISTTDREAKQKVEHMPKFKSDATRVYCKGMGLKKAFAGKPNTLTVNCSEAGFNMIYVSFLGPNRNTIHECSVKHMGGQIYEVKYTCKDKGDAMLMVKYGDEQIPGSPFKLECV